MDALNWLWGNVRHATPLAWLTLAVLLIILFVYFEIVYAMHKRKQQAVLRASELYCPNCQGGMTRTTVNMVCQSCGRDYMRANPTPIFKPPYKKLD